eukprot:gene14468-20270_t
MAPCGTEMWGTAVNDVCRRTCGLCDDDEEEEEGGGAAPAPAAGGDCVDTIADTASPIKDCSVVIKMAPCGTDMYGTQVDEDCSVVIKMAPCGTEMMGTQVSDVCRRTCGLCGGAQGPNIVRAPRARRAPRRRRAAGRRTPTT